MKTTIKIVALIVIVFFIIFISHDTTTNKTKVGYYWCYGEYCDGIQPSDKDIEASNSKLVKYHNSFIFNGKQVVTIFSMVANDPSSYYKGFAEMKNDTLHLDIKAETRLTYYFDTEMKACCSVFKFYFTSDEIPKIIYLSGQPIDSLKNQVIL